MIQSILPFLVGLGRYAFIFGKYFIKYLRWSLSMVASGLKDPKDLAKGAVDMFLQGVKKGAYAGAYAFLGASMIPYYANILKNYRNFEGTADEKKALANLGALTMIIYLLDPRNEIGEFFFEAMSEAFTEVFERVFKGGLEQKLRLMYGQEPIDDDEIKDIAMTGLFSPKFLAYISMMSGLFSTAVYSEILTGWSYNRDNTIRHLQNSALYHIIDVNNAFEYRITWQLQEAQDTLRDSFKWSVGKLREEMQRLMRNIRTTIDLINGLINLAIADAKSKENGLDAVVSDVFKQKLEEEFEKAKNNLKQIIDIMEGILNNLQSVIEELDNLYIEFLKYRISEIKGKIYLQLISEMDRSILEMQNMAKEVLEFINTIRKTYLKMGKKITIIEE